MARLSVSEFKEADKMPLVVVLDDVRSMYNVGSVFRTGDAFRIEAVCLCGISATPPSTEIHKTALGAEDSVEWRYYASATEAVAHLRSAGYEVLAVEQVEGSTKLHQYSPERGRRYAVVFGNEVNMYRSDVGLSFGIGGLYLDHFYFGLGWEVGFCNMSKALDTRFSNAINFMISTGYNF